MSETQVASPKVCFLADSYLVYKKRRDSPATSPGRELRIGFVVAGRVPAIHVS
jgi:hypothetical protein